MSRPHKHSVSKRMAMIRSYNLGERPVDIAAEHGVSPAYVINQAKDWERNQKLRSAHNLTQQVRKRTIVDPPPIEMPEPKHGITLARFSIQGRPQG